MTSNSSDKYLLKPHRSYGKEFILLIDQEESEMLGSYDVKKHTYSKKLSDEHADILRNLMVQECAQRMTADSTTSAEAGDKESTRQAVEEAVCAAEKKAAEKYDKLVVKTKELAGELDKLRAVGADMVLPETETETPGSSLFEVKPSARFKEESIQKGIVGEQRTAGVLSVLMNESCVRMIHSFKRSSMERDIDHVLFTRKGVFLINTKFRRVPKTAVQPFRDEWSENVCDDAREVALSASSVLNWTTTELSDEDVERVYHPTVVLWSESSYQTVEKQHHNGATLVSGTELLEHIRGLPDILAADSVVAMYEALRLSLV